MGAHEAEEAHDYERLGFGSVVWIEAQPNLIRKLNLKVAPPSRVIHALVWNQSGVKMNLQVASNGQSSSIFDFGTHKKSYLNIEMNSFIELTTCRLDEILPLDMSFNFLNLDIQGAEFEAMEGLGSRLAKFDYVYTEVNRAQLYKGIKEVGDIDWFLANRGFRRVATVWTKADWGDAFYLRVSQPLTKVAELELRAKTIVFALILWGRKSTILTTVRGALRRFRKPSQSKAQ